MATIPAHENEFPSLLFVEAAAPATPGTGLIIAYAKAGGVFAWKDDAGVEHIVGEGDTAAHLADTTDAHDASAISFTPAGTIAATDVQAAIEEVASEAGGGGTGQGLVDFAHARRTSGDVTLTTNNVWMDVDTGIDLTVDAAAGDVIEVSLSAYCSGSEAVTLYMDAHTIVAATPTNSVANGAAVSDSNDGVSAWRFPASTIHNSGGSVMYTLQAGDISGGTVTVRLRGKPASTTDRVLNATTARPLAWSVKNLGAAI